MSAADLFFVAEEDGFSVSQMKGSVLVIPDVSHGNVGQLAADLFISTMKVRPRQPPHV